MDIFSLIFSDDKKRRFRDPYLAVVVLEGGITDASVAPLRSAILKAKKDELCKGLVFRIDSPGGSALASEVLWEATEEFKSKSMLDVYDTFKKRIIEGRSDKLRDDLENLAGGRVYSGDLAFKHGLVDEIGGLSEAIAYASSKVDDQGLKTYLLPEPINPLDGLFSTPTTAGDDDEFISVNGSPKPLLDLRTQLKAEPTLHLFPIGKQRALQEALERLESINSDHILLVAPPLPLLR